MADLLQQFEVGLTNMFENGLARIIKETGPIMESKAVPFVPQETLSRDGPEQSPLSNDLIQSLFMDNLRQQFKKVCCPHLDICFTSTEC